MYDALVTGMGGDSVRYDNKGYNAQTWREDFYTSGKTLHKGFYVDGQLTFFKNFYENGQVERSYRTIDHKRAELKVFYKDGKLRSEIFYYEQNAQRETDYYPDGTIEFVEENEKNMEYLYKRNFYFENGNPESLMEISDKKAKTYLKKEFFTNGKMKEEGGLLFIPETHDYVRHGNWKVYDESGVMLKSQNYYKGRESE
jgi:antitoxin component YwqK of YwqJK toxin-antitoxin module